MRLARLKTRASSLSSSYGAPRPPQLWLHLRRGFVRREPRTSRCWELPSWRERSHGPCSSKPVVEAFEAEIRVQGRRFRTRSSHWHLDRRRRPHPLGNPSPARQFEKEVRRQEILGQSSPTLLRDGPRLATVISSRPDTHCISPHPPSSLFSHSLSFGYLPYLPRIIILHILISSLAFSAFPLAFTVLPHLSLITSSFVPLCFFYPVIRCIMTRTFHCTFTHFIGFLTICISVL